MTAPDSLVHVDRDAERAVLGGLLLLSKPSHVIQLVDRGLRAEDFYWEQHQIAFAGAVELAEALKPIDVITLRDAIETRPHAPGPLEIEELAACVPVSGNYLHYADVVIRKSLWRRRRAVVHNLLNAIELSDAKAWEELAGSVAPTQKPVVQHHLRVITPEGEHIRDERCPNCSEYEGVIRELQDQLKGANRDIRSWRSIYAKMARTKETEAQATKEWRELEELFSHWRRETGHERSKWTYDRFHVAEPFLKAYGRVRFEQAIAGIAFDPNTSLRRNGTTERHDGWDTLCRNTDRFERYANKAKRGWQPSIDWTDIDASFDREAAASDAEAQQRRRQIRAVDG